MLLSPMWRAVRDSLMCLLALAALLSFAPVLATGSTPSLGTDLLANVKPPGCTCSGGLPPNQQNPAIAAWGPYVLASWTDHRYKCLPAGNPGQSLGYSTDHGATFHDAGLLFGPSGTTFFGDPSVTVNRKTGDFYVSGYRRVTGQQPSGILALKGHFVSDSFQIEVRVVAALPAYAGDQLDRAWVAADSVSGRVYMTWWNYRYDGSTSIEVQVFDAALNPVGPVQTVGLPEQPDYALQSPQVAVGPSGEVYVAWGVVIGDYDGPESEEHQIVRSDDFGATFTPLMDLSELEANLITDLAGSRRPYGLSDPSIAVDASHGPHRGRVYVAWDEPVHWKDAPFGDHTAAFEIESNNTFATATPFVVGGKLRGNIAPGDVDHYTFNGTQGQVLVMLAQKDSTVSTGAIRVICSSSNDGSTLSNYHTISYSLGEGAVVGLPYTGAYTIQIDGDGSLGGSYVYKTAFDTPTAGDVARDHRDQVVSWSDDGGVTWSTPVRMNDSDPGFDGGFPSITVDDRGRVHCLWMDFRGSSCGDLSDAYTASSGDGGVTWGANRRMSDVSSYWNFLATCSVYNRGYYEQMTTSGNHVYAVWPDARLGDTDVFFDATLRQWSGSCPPATQASAGASVERPFTLSNEGSFDTPLEWRLVDSAGWLTGAVPGVTGSQMLAAFGGTQTITATVHVPEGCVDDSTVVLFITSDPYVPGAYDTCRTVVTCAPAAGVGHRAGTLSFAPPRPNPGHGGSRMSYSLSRTGPMRLELFGVNGARLRVIEAGVREAGPHELRWDGTDDDGRPAPPGVYFARLAAEGRAIERIVMMVR